MRQTELLLAVRQQHIVTLKLYNSTHRKLVHIAFKSQSTEQAVQREKTLVLQFGKAPQSNIKVRPVIRADSFFEPEDNATRYEKDGEITALEIRFL